MSSASVLESRAREYGAANRIKIAFSPPLGYGQDGTVWKTNRPSAVKVFARVETFQRELACYQLLMAKGIRQLEGFAIPRLVAYDERLLVIEMDIVNKPFIVDFGKCHVGKPDYTDEQWDEWLEGEKEKWDETDHWEEVWRLVRKLRAQNLYYMDPNPRNIQF